MTSSRCLALGFVAAGLLCSLLGGPAACSAREREPAKAGEKTTVLVASGLERPVLATHAPGDFRRLFILEQFDGSTGRVRILDLATGTLLPAPFLSISPVTTSNEQGLLGLAFHPRFAQNGLFYVNYTAPGGGDAGRTVIERYRAGTANPDVADPASRQTVITIAQPFSNHNGGWIGFGPDGFLYVGMGDGGAGNDPGNRAQNLGDLLGKMLRLDVDRDDFPAEAARNYAIPASNPFAAGGGAREIWSYGLRNPWRSSFDRATGDLWMGDVGQSAREEIDFQPAASGGGENWGWRVREGTLCTGLGGGPPCGDASLRPPVHEYGHGDGCSVTGGLVYRGSAIPSLAGAYLFADYCTARIWMLRLDAGGSVTEFADVTAELAPGDGLTIGTISSFGEDAAGEIYIVDHGGEVFKIVPQGGGCTSDTLPPAVTPPADLTLIWSQCTAGVAGASGSTSAALSAWLAGGAATDACDTAPRRLAPRLGGTDVTAATFFPVGTTEVSFRFRDTAGNVGTATARVTVQRRPSRSTPSPSELERQRRCPEPRRE